MGEMGKVALLWEGRFLYWRPIFWAIAVLTALLMAVALRLWQKQPLPPLLIAMPLAILLSVYCARLVHWYCRFESYESLSAALEHLGGGGYGLIGVFAGTLAALLLVRLVCLTKNLPALLDAVAPAAALGIAVGRWADLFTTADRGKMLLADEALHTLPYTAPVVNTSGVTEWRFATFAFQSIWCLAVFVITLLVFLIPFKRREQRERWRDGRVFLLFLLLYCPGQVVLDSTRYDALFLRSNGFVSLVQILCGATMLGVLALYSVRSIRSVGFRWYHPVLWLTAILGLGLAGFMEWYVQRHGDRFLFAYPVMSLGLLVYALSPLLLRWTTLEAREKGAEKETPASQRASA